MRLGDGVEFIMFFSLHTHTHTHTHILLLFLCVYNIGWTYRILRVNCQLTAILDFMMPSPLTLTHKWIMYYARTAVLTGHLSYEFIFYFSAGSSLQQWIPMEIISFSYLSDRCRAHNICIFLGGGVVRNTFHIFFFSFYYGYTL